MSLLKLSQIPLPLDHPHSKSTATHQLTQPSQRSPNASTTSFCENKGRNVKGEHVKPVFRPPLPKNAEPETEPDDGMAYSYDFKTSLPSQNEKLRGTKAGNIPIFPIRYPSSPSISGKTKIEWLKPEEFCIENDLKQNLGNNTSAIATNIKDSDSEGLLSFDSGTVYPVDLHQIDKVLDKFARRRASVGTLTSQTPALLPSKFALDATHRNNLKHSSIDYAIRGQRTRLLTDEGPGSPVAGRSGGVTSEYNLLFYWKIY